MSVIHKWKIGYAILILQLSGSRGAKKNKACKLEAHSFTQFHLTCMTKWKAHQNTQVHRNTQEVFMPNYQPGIIICRKQYKIYEYTYWYSIIVS